jgi:hypothetical protein
MTSYCNEKNKAALLAPFSLNFPSFTQSYIAGFVTWKMADARELDRFNIIYLMSYFYFSRNRMRLASSLK